MGNSTTVRPAGQSLDLHDDTQIYLCALPRVRVFEIDVFDTVGSILNFRASGLRIAREIIRRQGGEAISIELTHDKLAEALWSDIDPNARIRRFSRGLKNLREDMDLSGFYFVHPRKQKPQLTEDGFRGLPTLYEPGEYWRLSDAIQARAKDVDFFALSVERRRNKERAELKAILKEFGCKRIVREKKADDIKPANPSLPCRCACASCASCAAKAPVESSPSEEPVLSVQIEREKKCFMQMEEDMVSIGQKMLNRGGKLSSVDVRLGAISKAAHNRLRAAVSRQNKNNDYAPDTSTRAHGSAGLELAIEGMKDAAKAARELGKHKHADKLDRARADLETWTIFRNREVAQ